MLEDFNSIILLLAILYGTASGLWAYFSGRSKRKITKALSQVEQQEDLRQQMVAEIESAETTAKLFGVKTDTATWKKSTVLKNVTLYAKGQGYSWYNEEEWSVKIDEYVKGTKRVNFTQPVSSGK